MQVTLMTPGAILIEGTDALRFLQGQVTCDVEKLQSDHPMKGAICNNQGRVIATFWLCKNNLDYFMILPKEMLSLVIPHLQKYARFSKVTIKESEMIPFSMPSSLETIREGFPIIFPEHSGKFTTHELSLPQAGAISFDKGCYIGQEIVARVHYRGKTKQHLFHVELRENASSLDFIIINIAKRNDHFFEALVISSDSSLRDIKVIKSYE